MEVFFCTCPKYAERRQIADRCYAIWRAIECDLTLFTPEILGCSYFDFQRQRRIVADKHAKRDVYVLADDDCIPNDVEKALYVLRSHPEFGMISLWPSNAQICRWTPADYLPVEDLEVMEHYSVGGVRVCRKGAMIKGWPEQTGNGYDAVHCEALRASGWRVGYSQHSRMVHLGEGKSTVWCPSSSLAEVR